MPDARVIRQAARSGYYRWSSLAFLLGMAAHVGGQTHLYNLLRQRDLGTDAAALAIALLAAASVLAYPDDQDGETLVIDLPVPTDPNDVNLIKIYASDEKYGVTDPAP